MKEHELRDALRGAMATVTPPPPMSATSVMEGARRSRVRRRTIWAGAGSGLVAATVLVATAFIPGSPGQSRDAGGPGAAPNPGASKPGPWPTGPDGQPQEDRTARAGERYEKGATLFDRLLAMVPSGYTVPDRFRNGTDIAPSRYHQAEFEDRIGGTEVWSYLANLEVQQGERVGELMVEVYTAGNQLPTDPCALTLSLWGLRGDCEPVTVGTAQVGVVVRSTGDDRRLDQWAAYRHPDGVVVFVAQAARPVAAGEQQLGLTTLPFTGPQLAALATSEKLHLT
jgi:hypothetical protein